MTVYSVLLKPLIGIVGSLLLGTVLGLLVTWAERFFRSRGNSLSIAIAAVFAGAGLCELLAEYSFSSLLVCMMIGATVSNLSAKKKTVMEQTDRFTPPLFLLFFVLSGANLDLSVLPSVGIIGAAYIALRSFGKWFGTMTGAAAVKADGNIRKYLGLTLLPQAGVAIGMAQLVMPMFPDFGLKVNAVVLAATLVYELIGPVITKIALTKAGEIAAEK
jgi:NhaP-type Na+/H+ or K+/H+ antiporter